MTQDELVSWLVDRGEPGDDVVLVVSGIELPLHLSARSATKGKVFLHSSVSLEELQVLASTAAAMQRAGRCG